MPAFSRISFSLTPCHVPFSTGDPVPPPTQYSGEFTEVDGMESRFETDKFIGLSTKPSMTSIQFWNFSGNCGCSVGVELGDRKNQRDAATATAMAASRTIPIVNLFLLVLLDTRQPLHSKSSEKKRVIAFKDFLPSRLQKACVLALHVGIERF